MEDSPFPTTAPRARKIDPPPLSKTVGEEEPLGPSKSESEQACRRVDPHSRRGGQGSLPPAVVGGIGEGAQVPQPEGRPQHVKVRLTSRDREE